MRLFLAIAAFLAWMFGAMPLLIPVKFYAPTGIATTPMIATIAQALGISCCLHLRYIGATSGRHRLS